MIKALILKSVTITIVLAHLLLSGAAQTGKGGSLSGNILDENKKALEGATILLSAIQSPSIIQSTTSTKDGNFAFGKIPDGYQQLKISLVGFQPLLIDSIYFRQERRDFNLADIILKTAASQNLEAVIVYAEKPLIETKDGNIIFNAGESALSAGSNVSDLLTTVPLVTKDAEGKILLRGKEPKILIDDKPVELNLQQLQDLLESMPGSSIEKIEVLTNPPPQYANEQGGVINIITRKGKVGKSGRLTLYTGSRGETGGNANLNYRKQGLVATINAGIVKSTFKSSGYSTRKNIYADSSNFFNSNSQSNNQSFRPNLRANIDYDINKQHSLNLVVQYNQNNYDNLSEVEYQNLNRFDALFKLSNREIATSGDTYNPNLGLNYVFRSKQPGKILRVFTNANFSNLESGRLFYQQFLHPSSYTQISDSTQHQHNTNHTQLYNIRISYDIPLRNKKTFLHVGSYYTMTTSAVTVNSSYKRRGTDSLVDIAALNSDFRYHQSLSNLQASVKQVLAPKFSITAGLIAEATRIGFDIYKNGRDTSNDYWSLLPFFNLNKNWHDVHNITASYRRTIRRPGINELNPTVDRFDQYNTRFGNPNLKPSMVHSIDVVAGRTKKNLYLNVGVGYNMVENIYSQIRTRLSDTTSEISWQNISERKEYEASTWCGYTLNRNIRVNMSASYTYNQYSDFDKLTRRYRNGGSLTSNINSNYTWRELYTLTGSFTFNRFANPQGTTRSNLSMNMGLQAKILKKKMTVSVNIIDPFFQQRNQSFTYGPNYELESFNTTNTRNFRLSLGYNLARSPRLQGKQINKAQLKKIISK